MFSYHFYLWPRERFLPCRVLLHPHACWRDFHLSVAASCKGVWGLRNHRAPCHNGEGCWTGSLAEIYGSGFKKEWRCVQVYPCHFPIAVNTKTIFPTPCNADKRIIINTTSVDRHTFTDKLQLRAADWLNVTSCDSCTDDGLIHGDYVIRCSFYKKFGSGIGNEFCSATFLISCPILHLTTALFPQYKSSMFW